MRNVGAATSTNMPKSCTSGSSTSTYSAEIGADHSVKRMKLLIAGTGSSIVAKKLQKTAAIIAAAEPEGHAGAIQNALHRQIASTAASDDSSARPVSLCSTRLPSD